MAYRAKDFVATSENLLFAVVSEHVEDSKLLTFLRYYLDDAGHWRKLDSCSANALLQTHYSGYLHYSRQLDAHLHAVSLSRIVKHYQPQAILLSLLQNPRPDPVVADLQGLCHLLQEHGVDLAKLGVTGSLLIGLQNHASDIDLVFYERSQFHLARNVVQELIARDRCQHLSDADWLEAYQRRGCDFPLDEYIWHEERKYNKAMFNQRKFDLSLLAGERLATCVTACKSGLLRIEALVVDDQYAFDYPARYFIEHECASEIVCFTATFNGQARSGEKILVSGQLEIDEDGCRRIVVGSNREAIGEFIRVIR